MQAREADKSIPYTSYTLEMLPHDSKLTAGVVDAFFAFTSHLRDWVNHIESGELEAAKISSASARDSLNSFLPQAQPSTEIGLATSVSEHPSGTRFYQVLETLETIAATL